MNDRNIVRTVIRFARGNLGPGLVLLVSAVLWFGMLGYRDLMDPDEGRYAEIPAAMVSSGDWLTPRMNGFRYFEKPVLQYWATAAIFKAFGEGNATARLWTALTGFALALVTAFAASRLYGRDAGSFAYLITISSTMFVILGQLITLDMALTCFVVSALVCLILAQRRRTDPASTRNLMLLAWALLALGTLTKGPVAAVLPAGAVVIYSLWQRDFQLWQHLHLFKGLAVYLLIAAPWFVAVDLANPGFAKFFFIHEHFARFTSEVHHRAGPVYYFLPMLVAGVLPWLTTSLQSLLRPGFALLPANRGEFDPERLLWTFVAFTLVFFSLSHSKLPAYILPVVPVLAILSGGRLTDTARVGADRWVTALLGAGLLVAAFGVSGFTDSSITREEWLAFAPWLKASGVLLILGACALQALRRRPLAGYAVAALLCLGSLKGLLLGFNALSETKSGRMVAAAILKSVPADAPVFSLGTISESSLFYLGRNETLVEYKGEMAMGIDLEPDRYLATREEFFDRWRRLDQAALIVPIDTLSDLELRQLQGVVAYRGPKLMVVVKSP